jgi:hypothetical protein
MLGLEYFRDKGGKEFVFCPSCHQDYEQIKKKREQIDRATCTPEWLSKLRDVRA